MTDTTSRCASCAAGDHDPAEPFLEPCTCCANDHYPAALEGPRCGDHSRDNVGPRLVRLRERWEALRAAESRSGALAGEAPPEPGSGRSGEAGPQDDPT